MIHVTVAQIDMDPSWVRGPFPQNETHPRKEGWLSGYFPGGKRGMGEGYIPLVAVDVALPLKSVANCDNMPANPGCRMIHH